jgi:hypothetical protein
MHVQGRFKIWGYGRSEVARFRGTSITRPILFCLSIVVSQVMDQMKAPTIVAWS